MVKVRNLFVSAGLVLMLAGCEPPDFALPEGNVERGQALFVEYKCTSCHTVRDLDLPAPAEPGPVSISLGGKVSKLKTYQELVTSVINPSHKLMRFQKPEDVSQEGESLMTVYNDVMTVSDLIDLVAFLDSQYEVFERPGYRYTIYSERR